jgi:hypothetical protein
MVGGSPWTQRSEPCSAKQSFPRHSLMVVHACVQNLVWHNYSINNYVYGIDGTRLWSRY